MYLSTVCAHIMSMYVYTYIIVQMEHGDRWSAGEECEMLVTRCRSNLSIPTWFKSDLGKTTEKAHILLMEEITHQIISPKMVEKLKLQCDNPPCGMALCMALCMAPQALNFLTIWAPGPASEPENIRDTSHSSTPSPNWRSERWTTLMDYLRTSRWQMQHCFTMKMVQVTRMLHL